jgi:hypothetical protein
MRQRPSVEARPDAASVAMSSVEADAAVDLTMAACRVATSNQQLIARRPAG